MENRERIETKAEFMREALELYHSIPKENYRDRLESLRFLRELVGSHPLSYFQHGDPTQGIEY